MEPDRRNWADALQLSTVGITLAVSIAIGAGGGIWLDRHFKTEPIFTIAGFFLGVAAGFIELFRAVNRG